MMNLEPSEKTPQSRFWRAELISATLCGLIPILVRE